MDQFGASASQTVFIGDDVNDAEAMQLAGISIAPCDASQAAKSLARYITIAGGGRGCIREVADLILAAKGIDAAKLWARLHPKPESRDVGTV